MNSGPGLDTHPAVVNPLVKNGDCLRVPYEFIKPIGYATDKGYGPAPVTVENEYGTVTMWGYPVDD
jgi:hypothetical protein